MFSAPQSGLLACVAEPSWLILGTLSFAGYSCTKSALFWIYYVDCKRAHKNWGTSLRCRRTCALEEKYSSTVLFLDTRLYNYTTRLDIKLDQSAQLKYTVSRPRSIFRGHWYQTNGTKRHILQDVVATSFSLVIIRILCKHRTRFVKDLLIKANCILSIVFSL